jgi:spermidine/putrescine transport system permease protein
MSVNKLNGQKTKEYRFKFGESLLGFHSWAIYIFLYLPIIVLIVFSFSKSRGSSLSESLFTLNPNEYQTSLDSGIISEKLKKEFVARQYPLSEYATTTSQKIGNKWRISDKVIFDIDNASQTEWALNHKTVTEPLRQQFKSYDSPLSYGFEIYIENNENKSSKSLNPPLSLKGHIQYVSTEDVGKRWLIKDKKHTYAITKNDKKLNVLTDKNIVYSIKKVRDEIRVSLWYGFSLDWYKKLFTDREIFGPTKNSLIVAVISTIISTILGTMIAFAMSRFNFPGKNIFDSILLMPIIIPDIVMGISLLTFYVLIHFTLGLVSITIAHIAFNISFVAVVVTARLHGYDKTLDEVAMDLGANQFQTFMKVTLPLIAPGVIGGALIAFTLSLDDYLITSLVAGIGSTTLPIKVYSMMKFGVTPEINALSTLILFFTIVLILFAQRLGNLGGKI